MTTAAMHDVLSTTRDAVREAISCDSAKLLDLDSYDFEIRDDYHDAAHEIADSSVPVYYADLAACLADDLFLGDGPEDLEIDPSNVSVWTILQAAIYERCSIEAHAHAEQVATFAAAFTRGFVDALAWSERPDQCSAVAWGHSVEESIESIDSDSLTKIRADCVAFVCNNWHALDHASHVRDAEHLGHDYALTRNGHGTGYWDREELSDLLVRGVRGFERWHDDPTVSVAGILSDAARKADEMHLYVDESGRTLIVEA